MVPFSCLSPWYGLPVTILPSLNLGEDSLTISFWSDGNVLKLTDVTLKPTKLETLNG